MATPKRTRPTTVATASRTDRPAPGSPPVASAAGQKKYRIRIRMYRQGIGDCFLLSFPRPEGLAHILIDCGVVVGTENGTGWTQRIADDVAREVNSNNVTGEVKSSVRLNAIVGTHPHWDHLSGFLTAFQTFSKIRGDEIWMAWTEDPSDPEGRAMNAKHATQISALRMAVSALASTDDETTRSVAAGINSLLAFHGPDDALQGMGATGGLTTAAAVSALRNLGDRVHYWNPGDIITRDWLPGVRIYVLGPPRDTKLLGRLLSKNPEDLYSLTAAPGFGSALGVGESSSSAGNARLNALPFDASLLFPTDSIPDTAELPLEKRVAQPPRLAVETTKRRYTDPDAGWRRIDGQWLLSAQTLALQLDNAINNLSLVLAFEFEQSGEVLLFAADAQVGNWQSWKTVQWNQDQAANLKRQITPKDLLARTVFYKVGHHASHNATLKENGLEDMTNPNLVAAITVDEAFAKGSKRWQMPASALYSRLLEKTEGRLIRSDGIGPCATGRTDAIADNARGQAFKERVALHPVDPTLSVDYYVI